MTLIELLITLSLMVIIGSVVFSVFSFGFKGFSTQTSSVDQQANVRYVMGYLTKEIRKADYVGKDGSILKITNGSTDDEYKLVNHILMKNSDELAKDIERFEIEKNGDKIKITIESIQDNNGQSSSLATEINFRK